VYSYEEKILILAQTTYRSHFVAHAARELVGTPMRLCGWIEAVRDHGGVLFFHLRDATGKLQVILDPRRLSPEAAEEAGRIRPEWVVKLSGVLRLRPPGTENTSLDSRDIELEADGFEVLATVASLPFRPQERDKVSEERRLKHRTVDLRSDIMQANLRLRHQLISSFRSFLNGEGFIEVETPCLAKSTPEGARDFLVPSRLQPGTYFALPQSPQLFKQALMAGGIERYYQVARCFRDEDLRANRQPEFTQLDMEASFVNESDVMRLVESMVRTAMEDVGRPLPSDPFPVLTYEEAMDRYGADAPDLRFGLPIVNLTDVFADTEFHLFRKILDAGGQVLGLAIPGSFQVSRKGIEAIREEAEEAGAEAPAWGRIEGGGFSSSLAKFFSEKERAAIAQAMGKGENDLILFQAGKDPKTLRLNMGRIRLLAADFLGLTGEQHRLCFAWIVRFPLLEYDPSRGRYVAVHHPFTSPVDLSVLQSGERSTLDSALAASYDLVLNGQEVGGGSIRIHNADLQRRMLGILGLGAEEIEARFGFLLQALSEGAPPHGGVALGLDRFASILTGCDSIRDVIAFPKTQTGTCPFTGAPTHVARRGYIGL
jgi:aspartyl-tRNA synthetase